MLTIARIFHCDKIQSNQILRRQTGSVQIIICGACYVDVNKKSAVMCSAKTLKTTTDTEKSSQFVQFVKFRQRNSSHSNVYFESKAFRVCVCVYVCNGAYVYSIERAFWMYATQANDVDRAHHMVEYAYTLNRILLNRRKSNKTKIPMTFPSVATTITVFTNTHTHARIHFATRNLFIYSFVYGLCVSFQFEHGLSFYWI